jgi:tRNA U34 5-methylaminomethyl-2-thiouridine-forming methyltransferase MnmC
MTIPHRKTFDSVDSRWQIRITDDGSPTLVDRDSGDSMHSGCGAWGETQHVYLRNSGIESRLQNGVPSRVLEIGLGSGMGCLMTAELAESTGVDVQYVALERLLPPSSLVRQLEFASLGIRESIIEDYCRLLDDAQQNLTNTSLHRSSLAKRCELAIHIGDALLWNAEDERAFDAIYFDPYSPESNAELWDEPFLSKMHDVLASGGRLVSYCVNRRVRDRLSSVGFEVQRVRGPVGGKREVLIAINP